MAPRHNLRDRASLQKDNTFTGAMGKPNAHNGRWGRKSILRRRVERGENGGKYMDEYIDGHRTVPLATQKQEGVTGSRLFCLQAALGRNKC